MCSRHEQKKACPIGDSRLVWIGSFIATTGHASKHRPELFAWLRSDTDPEHMEPWGSLTCGRLLEMAETVQAKIKEGKENNNGGLQFEKLTHGFWREYIRRETLLAGGEGKKRRDTRAHRTST